MSGLSLISQAMVALVLGLPIAYTFMLRGAGRWNLFDPLSTFWAGIVIVYVIQPLTFGRTFISWHDEEVLQRTLLACILGIIGVIAGYQAKTGYRVATRLPYLPEQLCPKKLFIAGCTLLVLGVLGYIYLIKVSGGWNAWIAVSRGGTDYEQAKGYLPELANGVPAGIFILFLRAQVYKTSAASKALAWLAASLLLWWFFYLGSRSRLIISVLLFLSAIYLPRRRNPGYLLVIILFMVLCTATNIQQNFRDRFTRLSLNLSDVDSTHFWGAALPVFVGGDLELQRGMISEGIEFNCAMSVIRFVPDPVPYNLGYGFLELLTRPVPRSLWPTKPHPHLESVQGVLRQANLTESSAQNSNGENLLMGPAFTFVGHWYYVGGWVGMAFGGFLTGILFRFIRGFLDRSRGSQSVLLVYPFLLIIGFSEAASTPWYWFYTLPFIILPFIGVCYYAEKPIGSHRLPRCVRPSGPSIDTTASRISP